VTESDHLLELLAACHRTLSALDKRADVEDDVTKAIAETCRAVEARLAELGVDFESSGV